MKLIFAGTPEFAACALRAILAAGHDVALVLTQPTSQNSNITKRRIYRSVSGGGIAGLFSTHPATEERVARLRNLNI